MNNWMRWKHQQEYNAQNQIAFTNIVLNGVHAEHQLDAVIKEVGPHAGKVVCITCDKHVAWIPKAVLETL